MQLQHSLYCTVKVTENCFGAVLPKSVQFSEKYGKQIHSSWQQSKRSLLQEAGRNRHRTDRKRCRFSSTRNRNKENPSAFWRGLQEGNNHNSSSLRASCTVPDNQRTPLFLLTYAATDFSQWFQCPSPPATVSVQIPALQQHVPSLAHPKTHLTGRGEAIPSSQLAT